MIVGREKARVGDVVVWHVLEVIVVVIVVCSVGSRSWRSCLGFFENQRFEHVAEDSAEEDNPRDDEKRSLPLVGGDQIVCQWSEHNSAKSWATDGDPSRERSIFLEVHRDTDDGWQVNHSEAEPCSKPDGDVQSEDILCKHAENHANWKWQVNIKKSLKELFGKLYLLRLQFQLLLQPGIHIYSQNPTKLVL